MANPRVVDAFTIHPINVKSLQENQKQQRRRSIIREFALNTTAHGLPGIARSQSVYNRLFWTVCTLIFSGIMLYFIIESIRTYFDYLTQTSIDIGIQWPQYFPAFSICNICVIRFDKFIGPFLNYTNTRNLTNTNDTSSISSYQSLFIAEFLQYMLNGNQSVAEFMFPLSSMLITCKYNGVNCTAADFLTFISPTYGLCYTFNAKVKNGTIRSLTENGATGKLELRLYTHTHQYVRFLTDSVGMVGMIHDNTQMPLIDVAGLPFAPGRKHKLCFGKKSYFVLPSPYSQCTDQVSFAMQALFNQFYNAEYGYSQLTCAAICIQAYTYYRCGCVSLYQWSLRSIVLPGTSNVITAPICNLTDTCYVTAANEFMTFSNITSYFCPNCQQECTTVDYPVKISSAFAPPDWVADDVKLFVENSSILLPSDWSTSWRTHIQNSYVAIDVVRESILVESYTQQATISSTDLLSNVGGQTGLWIGISFLSLIEVAEMLYRLIRYQYKWFLNTRIKGTVSQVTHEQSLNDVN